MNLRDLEKTPSLRVALRRVEIQAELLGIEFSVVKLCDDVEDISLVDGVISK